jgi:hypothetical protein
MFDGTTKFLDGAPIDQVTLTSFRHSGSTELRRLLEKVTGIYTGSTESLHSESRLQL